MREPTRRHRGSFSMALRPQCQCKTLTFVIKATDYFSDTELYRARRYGAKDVIKVPGRLTERNTSVLEFWH